MDMLPSPWYRRPNGGLNLKDFVILLRRKGSYRRRKSDLPLDANAVVPKEQERVQATLESHGIELLDFITSLGIFEIVLLCRAESITTVAELVGDLSDDWDTDALLATSHLRFESVVKTPFGTTERGKNSATL